VSKSYFPFIVSVKILVYLIYWRHLLPSKVFVAVTVSCINLIASLFKCNIGLNMLMFGTNANSDETFLYMQMAREMDEILRQQIAQTANSCTSEDGVSFLDHVILPLYDVISAVSLPHCFVI
jgi:hypothetical protein